jgi:hypothetical protein
MKLNKILLVQQAIELLETALDASPQEIIDCLELRLISKKEAEQLANSLQ